MGISTFPGERGHSLGLNTSTQIPDVVSQQITADIIFHATDVCISAHAALGLASCTVQVAFQVGITSLACAERAP